MTVAWLTSGVAPAAQAQAQQTAAGVVLSIGAESSFARVTGDVFVVYNDGQDSRATIKAAVSGAAPGDVAALYARPFPFKRPAARVAGQAITLQGPSAAHSFVVRPAVATRYTVRVLRGGQVIGGSAARTVYVIARDAVVGSMSCAAPGRPVCTVSFRVRVFVPASAYKLESGKAWYVYTGLRTSPTTEPPAPTSLTLNSGATVGKPLRISATVFRRQIQVSFPVGNDGFSFKINYCARDTEGRDGVGLPGKHGCGTLKTIAAGREYLG
ncbi:MAG TPA: hypothetical protein VGI58_14670 [Streptosporangiaceae bacterium]